MPTYGAISNLYIYTIIAMSIYNVVDDKIKSSVRNFVPVISIYPVKIE